MNADNIFIYEDHARITILDDIMRQRLSTALLETREFEEVVLGIEELCVKFDPEYINDNEVKYLISQHLKSRNHDTISSPNHHRLDISFDHSHALDINHVAHIMEMNEAEFQNWFLQQRFRVQMMGFQPGFVYLSHDIDAPEIKRLNIPRAKVAAGSIGFLGTSACIYAHDGPGGWPIIGKVKNNIFDTANTPPNLLNSGDNIIFHLS